MADHIAPPFPILASLLVGRERELAALRDALAVALAGRGSLVLIGGEAGIGKTALAESLCREATARGALILVGRCYDLVETPPYGPWAEALARAPRGGELPERPDLGTGDGTPGQAALFAGVRDYLAALAAFRPVVILLDDLHWADPASLELLRILARQLADLPLLLLATYRADELTRRHILYTLLPLLTREARALRVDIGRLDYAGLRQLVRGRHALPPTDEARLVGYLAARSEGNPFYAGELLRALEEQSHLARDGASWKLGDLSGAGVPAILRQVLDARLDRLGDEVRSLLAVAAVLGQEAPLDLWAAVSGASEEALVGAVERAMEARLLAETPEGVRFAHALIREALYEGTLALRRRALHRRVADALLARPRPDPDAVASHLSRARDPRAATWLIRAGDRALRAIAARSAVERYEAALALLAEAEAPAADRGWVCFRLAHAIWYHASRQSVDHVEEAARLGLDSGDRALTGNARFWLGSFRYFGGAYAQGMADLEVAAELLAGLSPSEVAGLRDRAVPSALDGVHAAAHLVFYRAFAGRFDAARVLGERTLGGEGVGVLDANALAALHRGLGTAYAALGDPNAALVALAAARAASRLARNHSDFAAETLDEFERVRLPYQAEGVTAWAGLADEAARPWPGAAGTHAGDTFTPEMARLPLLVLAGEWTRAGAVAQAGLAIGGGGMFRRLAGIVLAPLARWRGDRERGLAIVREVLPAGPDAAPGSEVYFNVVTVQRQAAALALDAGDLPAARRWLEAHDHWLAWSGAVLGRAEGQLGWAAYHRAAGDPNAALARAQTALAAAAEPHQPLALLAAHRLLGELATTDARTTDAQIHLDAALALAEACAAPYERALTRLALAELRAVEGQGEQAAGLVAETRAILEALGAAPALSRADELAATLASQAKTAFPSPAGLSVREIEVLRLVAAGLSNADIAARLFLSTRTVEQHLRTIYNKTGAPSRTAVTRFALEHGLR